MEALIQADHLHKTFNHRTAVNDVNLHVASGEIYGLMGPDGAGKTTIMRLLCGALRPTRERDNPTRIQIAGYDILRHTEPARAQIGYLPQRFSLYEDLTVLENIRFFAEVRGLPTAKWRPRCMEILEFVGLATFLNRRAGNLSGGMKQKLGLAAALVHRPRVLLLDEPTTGVDPVTRQDFWQLIIRLAGTQEEQDHIVAVLISTPYMDEAARCNRVGFIQNGHLIVEGTPADLRARLEDRMLVLIGTPLRLLHRVASADPGVVDVQMFGDRLHLRVHPGERETIIQRLQRTIPDQGGEISRLSANPPQLEDVYMSLAESKS